jgi:hypothetical protein
MSRLRHLSYANVVSTLALVIAIAGGTTAIAITASKNSVTSKSIRKGAVRASELGPVVVVTKIGGSGGAAVSCPAGTRIVSGGGSAAGGSASLRASVPEANGWSVRALPASDAPMVFALCLKK